MYFGLNFNLVAFVANHIVNQVLVNYFYLRKYYCKIQKNIDCSSRAREKQSDIDLINSSSFWGWLQSELLVF